MPAERYKERPQGLSPRQCGYVLNLVQGMSRRGAARAAGYSERSAENVAQAVEGKKRGRFSMMRRLVQLLRSNRPELVGRVQNGISSVGTIPSDSEREASRYQRGVPAKPLNARPQIAALEAKEKLLREAILRSGEIEP